MQAPRGRRFHLMIGLFWIAAAAGSGCARRVTVPPEGFGATGGANLAHTLAAIPCPDRIAGDLELTVSVPGRSTVRLFGSMRASWPDRIRLQLRLGPFMPVATICVDADSARVILPRAEAYWAGESKSGANGWTTVTAGLLGALCPNSLADGLRGAELSPGHEGWILAGESGDRRFAGFVEFILDPEHPERVLRLTIRDGNERLFMRAVRSGRRRVGAADLPKQLRVTTGEPASRFDIRLLRFREDLEQPPGLYKPEPKEGLRRLTDEDFRMFFEQGGEG